MSLQEVRGISLIVTDIRERNKKQQLKNKDAIPESYGTVLLVVPLNFIKSAYSEIMEPSIISPKMTSSQMNISLNIFTGFLAFVNLSEEKILYLVEINIAMYLINWPKTLISGSYPGLSHSAEL